MLLKFFKNNHPYVLFLIPLLSVVLWIPALFNVPIDIQSADTGNTTFVFNWVLRLLSFHQKASIIFALILVIIESYILIRLNFKYIFIDNRTYLPAVFLVVFSSVFSSYQILHPMLIGNLFLLFAINKSFLSDDKKNHFKRYYESGLFLGFGALFYPNIYVFIFVIWLTMVILRNFNLREWFLSVIGIATPFVFYLVVLFLSGKNDEVLNKLLAILIAPTYSLSFSVYSLFAVGFLIFVTLISLLSGIRIVGIKKISIRKYYSLFSLFLIYIVALFIFYPSLGYELIIPLSIPLSIVCSVHFTEIRSKLIGEVLFTLLLLSVFVIIWIR